MAKKTRIDRRGKIRSLVRKFPTGQKPHWSITKRAAVNRRRRIIDDLFLQEFINVSDAISKHQQYFLTDAVGSSDTANINGEKIVINSQTITDDGGIAKNFQQPTNADSLSLSDSIGFELASSNSMFNVAKINDFFFNGEGDDFEFFTDSVTTADAISLHTNKGISETASTSDSIGLNIQLNKTETVNIADSVSVANEPSFASAATISDVLLLDTLKALTDTTTASDSIGMSLIVPNQFNGSTINLSQFN